VTLRTMQSRLAIAVLLPLAVAAACAGGKRGPGAGTPPEAALEAFVESGFLTTDYSRLAPVAPGSVRRAYVNEDQPFSNYDKIFVDRITIWRDDDHEQEVGSADFQKLVDDLYAELTRELRKTFELVGELGPGVARMRVALVAIDDPDDRLDVYVSRGEPSPMDSSDPLPPGLRQFGRQAWMEAELLDGVSDRPLFAVVDRAADVIPHAKPIETWRNLHEAFEAWVAQAARRLAELKREH
jgi:hypothetical protein